MTPTSQSCRAPPHLGWPNRVLDLYDELKAVLSALEKAEVPYALCGGLALAVYGHPRATVDIDLLVPADFVR